MQRPESVSIDDIAPDSRKRYNKDMNSNEEKKEYRKPELVYIAFDDSVIVASMDIGGGTGKSGDGSLEGQWADPNT